MSEYKKIKEQLSRKTFKTLESLDALNYEEVSNKEKNLDLGDSYFYKINFNELILIYLIQGNFEKIIRLKQSEIQTIEKVHVDKLKIKIKDSDDINLPNIDYFTLHCLSKLFLNFMTKSPKNALMSL